MRRSRNRTKTKNMDPARNRNIFCSTLKSYSHFGQPSLSSGCVKCQCAQFANFPPKVLVQSIRNPIQYPVDTKVQGFPQTASWPIASRSQRWTAPRTPATMARDQLPPTSRTHLIRIPRPATRTTCSPRLREKAAKIAAARACPSADSDTSCGNRTPSASSVSPS